MNAPMIEMNATEIYSVRRKTLTKLRYGTEKQHARDTSLRSLYWGERTCVAVAKWYTLAAKSNYPAAHLKLGRMFEAGF